MERADFSRSGEPAPAAGCIVSRCWSTCPCAEAGFLYGVFSTRSPGSHQKNPPWGVSLSHTWHWEATHPSCESGEAVILRSRSGEFCLSGACVFSGLPWLLCLCYSASGLFPCFPSHCHWSMTVKELKGRLSITWTCPNQKPLWPQLRNTEKVLRPGRSVSGAQPQASPSSPPSAGEGALASGGRGFGAVLPELLTPECLGLTLDQFRWRRWMWWG